ncbi:MAG TPA: AAA family ATPase [Nocardioidaceae bacterium]|nr:AAA family ATPase [Nocardioidaceae bacterium]
MRDSPDGRGRIILLNGTSSSGKSTLARALQDALPDPWTEIGIDRFVFSLPGRYLRQPLWSEVFRYVPRTDRDDGSFTIETGPLGQRLMSGMHRTAASLAAAGLDVIVDHVILEASWLEECLHLWAPYPVLLVGVRCPLDVVEQREHDRRDRTIGQAAAQHDVVHRWCEYDVEVDTSVLPAAECAGLVLEALRAHAR